MIANTTDQIPSDYQSGTKQDLATALISLEQALATLTAAQAAVKAARRALDKAADHAENVGRKYKAEKVQS